MLLLRSRARRCRLDPGDHGRRQPEFYVDALVISLVLFFGALVLGLLAVVTVPRVLSLFLAPDKVYPLYGVRYRSTARSPA